MRNLELIIRLLAITTAIASFKLQTVNGFPTVAGTCKGGSAAVGGSHVSTPMRFEGSLDDIGVEIIIGNALLSPDSDPPILSTGEEYSLEVKSEYEYKGVLVRLEHADGVTDLSTAIAPGLNTKVAYTCTPPIGGIDHLDAAFKSSSTGTIIVDEPGDVSVDVTVVVFNNLTASVFGYTRYIIKFEGSTFAAASEELSDTPSMVPSVLPSSVPSTAPAFANDQNQQRQRRLREARSLRLNLRDYLKLVLQQTADSASPSSPDVMIDYPSMSPSSAPTASQIEASAEAPIAQPSGSPSESPIAQPSDSPSESPIAQPSGSPSESPSTLPSDIPSITPSVSPSSFPSQIPSDVPSSFPSSIPSDMPSLAPTSKDNRQKMDMRVRRLESRTNSQIRYRSRPETRRAQKTEEIELSDYPSTAPINIPSGSPSSLPTEVGDILFVSDAPSTFPSDVPSSLPSSLPVATSTGKQSKRRMVKSQEVELSDYPSTAPIGVPSGIPSVSPTEVGDILFLSDTPSTFPSDVPSTIPSSLPVATSTGKQSKRRMQTTEEIELSDYPSLSPIGTPSTTPSLSPTAVDAVIELSDSPSSTPIDTPSILPSIVPTTVDAGVGIKELSDYPSSAPSEAPNSIPSIFPTAIDAVIAVESDIPSALPNDVPSYEPSGSPVSPSSSSLSDAPSGIPATSAIPTISILQSDFPSSHPTVTENVVAEPEAIEITPEKRKEVNALMKSLFNFDRTRRRRLSLTDSKGEHVDASNNARLLQQYVFVRPDSTEAPITVPSAVPSNLPSDVPSRFPSDFPSLVPSNFPNLAPSGEPSFVPSFIPTATENLIPDVEVSSVLVDVSEEERKRVSSLMSSLFSSRKLRGQSTGDKRLNDRNIADTSNRNLRIKSLFEYMNEEISDAPSSMPIDVPSFVPSSAPTNVANVIAFSDAPSLVPSDYPSITPSAAPVTPPKLTSEERKDVKDVIDKIFDKKFRNLQENSNERDLQSLYEIKSVFEYYYGESSDIPSTVPSGAPNGTPSGVPSSAPTEIAGIESSLSSYSDAPSLVPSDYPNAKPSLAPSIVPSGYPTLAPLTVPDLTPEKKKHVIDVVDNLFRGVPRHLEKDNAKNEPRRRKLSSTTIDLDHLDEATDKLKKIIAIAQSVDENPSSSDSPSLTPVDITTTKSDVPSLMPSDAPSTSPV